MTGWIILLIILAVLIILSLIRLGAKVSYNEEGLMIALIVGPARIQWLPKQEKDRSKQTKPEKKKTASHLGEKTEQKSGGTVGRILKLLPLAAEAAGKLLHKIRIDRLDLRLVWGAGDAASAAIGFGRANALMGMIWPLIDHNFKVKRHDLQVDMDYNKTSPEITADAAVTITVGQLLSFVVIYGVKLLLNWSRSGKALREKQEAFQ